MKKFMLVFCTLFIVQSISGEVWIPEFDDFLNLESFRHQATQSIEDDLDNGIDGTDIFKVEGARIYTNLSNLVSGQEQFGNNATSANTVVIGATSPVYRNWKLTAFYGNDNLTEYEEGEQTLINRLDTDADDVFDRFGSRYFYSSRGQYRPANTMLINIGKKLERGTEIAFTYRRSTSETRIEIEDSTHYTLTNLNNDDLLALQDTSGHGKEIDLTSQNLYSLSYSKPYRDWNLRGDLFLSMGNQKDNQESLSYTFVNNDPADLLTTDTDLDSTAVDDTDEYSANLLGVNLRLSDENEYGVYWEISGNYGIIFGSGDYKDITRERTVDNYMIGTDVAEMNEFSRESVTAPISVSGNAMGIKGRMEWKISDNVSFGLGLLANTFSLNREYEVEASNLSVEDFDDGDNEVDDTDDYVTTSLTNQVQQIYTEKSNYNRIIIPAGIELNFGKNKDWYMRLGALSIGSKREAIRITDITSAQRDSTITVLGDGSSTETLGDAITYANWENKASQTEQDVYYSYGLGWKPSENLSLDLVGMFDATGVELLSTDWLSSLKLSATINIY